MISVTDYTPHQQCIEKLDIDIKWEDNIAHTLQLVCFYFCLAFILMTEFSRYLFKNFANCFYENNLLNDVNIVAYIIRYFIQSRNRDIHLHINE